MWFPTKMMYETTRSQEVAGPNVGNQSSNRLQEVARARSGVSNEDNPISDYNMFLR